MTLDGLQRIVGQVLVAASVCLPAIAVYDRTVREPSTPRLAVVDIARLYEAAERGARRQVLEEATGASAPGGAVDGRPAAEVARRTAERFGSQVETVLGALSAECRCAIVAMAAVIGGNATIPDFTVEAARRLGVEVRSSYASAP